MKNKYWIIILVLLVIAVVAFYFLSKDKEETSNFGNLERVNKIENVVQNEISNVIDTNNTTTENKQEESGTSGGEKSSETMEESPKTAEDKAVNIVKKDYGEKAGISFRVEGMNSKGEYVVKVVDSATTAVLEFYYVNVAAGTFTK